jgi:hypothetical protein
VSINVSFATTSSEILKKMIIDVKAKPISRATLPQNLGGEAPKLNVNQHAQLSSKALAVSILDEAVLQNVEREIIHPLRQMLLSRSLDLKKITNDKAQFNSMTLTDAVTIDDAKNLSRQAWKIDQTKLNSTQFTDVFSKYLQKFSVMEYSDLAIFSTSTPLSERNTKTSFPKLFNIETRLDLRGYDINENRVQVRGILNIVAAQVGDSPKWIIKNLAFVSGEEFVARQSSFSETNLFVKSPENYLRKEAIRRGGYALAVNDINGDGHLDMIVGHMGPMEIFTGTADGKFVKVENSALGFHDETLVKSVVIADFDNNGTNDVLLVRFAPSEEKGNDILLYQNVKGHFAKATSINNRLPAYYAMPSAVADYNNDGLLDFYIGFPGAKDFTVLNKTNVGFEGIKELHPQGLFYNTGGFAFNEVTKQKLPYSKTNSPYQKGYPESALIFPHTSQGIDYDLDGDMDIVVVDDKANLSPLYKNSGDGNFEQVADKIGVTNYDFGMGFAAADFDNDGTLEFVYTNVNFLPSERLHNNLVKNFSDYSQLPGTYGVRMFKTSNGKQYSDVTALSEIGNCGEGIGGVVPIDYNNDGYMDLYVVNGLWSGTTRDEDLSSIFVRAYSTFNFDYQEVLGDSVGVEEANTSFMKILMGFEGNVSTGKVKKGTHPSMACYQRNCLFRNNKNGTFTDVGFLEGVDSIADGYVAGTADLNKDGKMDLVLRNADPGVKEYKFPSVQVFMNKSPDTFKSIEISFAGKKTNKSGIGVIAEGLVGGQKLIRHLVANNGSIQTDFVLHFGLGRLEKMDELKIKWPSGVIDTFHGVQSGKYIIEEGSSKIEKLVSR